MKPVDWISTEAPLADLYSAGSGSSVRNRRTVRERCALSGLNPNDPLPPISGGSVRPSREVFKRGRHAAESSKGDMAPQETPKTALPAQTDASLKKEKPAAPAPSAEPTSPTQEAPPGDQDGPMTLKLPIQAQIALIRAIMAGRRDVLPLALELLQTNLRNSFWPGVLRVYNTDPASPDFSLADVPKTAAPLVCGEEKFGLLVLEGSSPSPRVLDQLRQAAVWLASMLSMTHRLANLQRLADTDELSGAFNRRYFLDYVPKLLERARRDRFCVTILLFDIDDFKQYNDQFGHAAGDAIIREVIGLLRHCTRSRDLVARIGGDEFAVVFWDEGSTRHPESQHPRNVLTVAQRFRKAVEEHPWNTEDGPISGKLSISGGLATFPWDAQNVHDLMVVADGELMRAKSMGKNAIILAGPDQSNPPQPEPGSEE
jgi:diguanylate cyclase (GGDEF)-like protein